MEIQAMSPNIDEQIAWMRHTGPDYGEHDAAIIETLERYKRVVEVLFDPRYAFGSAGRVHDCQRILTEEKCSGHR